MLDKSSERRAILDDSFTLQQFERDCDETKGWINEKLKFATDDSYLVSSFRLSDFIIYIIYFAILVLYFSKEIQL